MSTVRKVVRILIVAAVSVAAGLTSDRIGGTEAAGAFAALSFGFLTSYVLDLADRHHVRLRALPGEIWWWTPITVAVVLGLALGLVAAPFVLLYHVVRHLRGHD